MKNINTGNKIRESFIGKRSQYYEQIEKMFNDGVSVLEMAKRVGRDRTIVYSCLKDLGKELRSGSEANKIRFAKASPEYIEKITSKAHAAVRGKKRSLDELIIRAKTHQFTTHRVGKFENTTAAYFESVGLNAIRQRAVYVYNLDIGCGNVAVEIHNTSAHPHCIDIIMKRMIQLGHCGLHFFYIKVSRSDSISIAAMEKAVAFIQEASRFDTGVCHYRMVNSHGQDLAAFQYDLNSFSDIEIPEKSSWVHHRNPSIWK